MCFFCNARNAIFMVHKCASFVTCKEQAGEPDLPDCFHPSKGNSLIHCFCRDCVI